VSSGISRGEPTARAWCPPSDSLSLVQTAAGPKGLELTDLTRIQDDLRATLQPLSDSAFEKFVRLAFYESGSGTPELASVEWPRVLEELRGLAGERKLADRTLAYLDLQRAYYVAAVRQDPDRALVLLDAALARYRERSDYRAELALIAENIERDEEHWDRAREYLAQAEDSLATVPPTTELAVRFHGDSAEFWIDLGLAELARPHVELELEYANGHDDPLSSMRAWIDELKLVGLEDDYAAIATFCDELECEPWFARLRPSDQGLCFLQAGTHCVSAEHDGFANRGHAAMLLDRLVVAGAIDPAMRPWVLRQRATCAADAGDWTLARKLAASLRAEIGAEGAPDDYVPPGRLGAALIALDARIELAQTIGTPDRERKLREQLERLRRSWKELLAHWSVAPVRSGGLAYLHIGERHQILQELIELELAVGGDESGASCALQEVLDAQQQSTFSRRMRLSPASVDDIHRDLTDEHSGLLVYVCSRDRSFAFAVDPRGVRVFRLDPEYRVREPCQSLAAAAQAAVHGTLGIDDPEMMSAAVNCAQKLLPAKLAEHIAAWRDVLIVGIDDFGYVPFELFPAAEGGSQGMRRAVSYCTTVATALALRHAPNPLERHARFLLSPGIDGAKAPLTLSADERRVLTDSFVDPPEVLTNSDAQAPRLGVGPGEGVALLYVLAHGTHDSTRERPSGLLMWSGAVWAEDIESMRTPRIVLLTACEAGRAPMRRGDGGRSDLAAAFLYAGASTVVLPTCDLELDSTLRAVPRVLHALSGSTPTADAMRAARANLVAEGDAVAALQAHLLHVIGCGKTSLPRVGQVSRPSPSWLTIWAPIVLGAVALITWIALIRKRNCLSRTHLTHGSRVS